MSTLSQYLLRGDISLSSIYLTRRILYLVLRIYGEQETDDRQTLILITYSRGTLSFDTFKQKDKFVLWIDRELNVLAYEPYVTMYEYPPVSGLKITELVRPYANGNIELKRYSIEYKTETILLPSNSPDKVYYNTPTTYAVLTIESTGTNARYGVKIENIPAFPSFIAIEHVHLGRSWRRSVVEIRLYSQLV